MAEQSVVELIPNTRMDLKMIWDPVSLNEMKLYGRGGHCARSRAKVALQRGSLIYERQNQSIELSVI